MKVGNNIYLYYVHEWREEGRRRRHKCYLGPLTNYIKPYIFFNRGAAERLARRILQQITGGEEGE